MRVRRRLLSWGVFLVSLGAVPLAVQTGLLSPSAAAEILRYWPLILIAIGIGLVLRFTRFDVLGVIISATTGGLLLGALLVGGISSVSVGCGAGQAGGPTTTRTGSAGPALSVGAELTCGEIEVARSPGDAWTVDAMSDGTPAIQGTDSSLSLRSASEVAFGPIGGRRPERWVVSLPSDSVLSASFTVNAGRSRLLLGNGALSDVGATFNAADGLLDLTGATPTTSISVSSTLNASSIGMILPDAPLNGSVTLNASSLDLCVPPQVGLRISYDETLSSNNFGQAGLTGSDQSWTTANFASATTRVELHLSANVSSTTLNPAGGCQ